MTQHGWNQVQQQTIAGQHKYHVNKIETFSIKNHLTNHLMPQLTYGNVKGLTGKHCKEILP